MPTKAELLAHAEKISTLPDDALLGYVLWSTVQTDFKMRHSDFIKLAQDFGLDLIAPGALPHEPLGSDVYRRALKAHEQSSVVDDKEYVHNFLIRRYRGKHQIVREIHAPRGKKLSYKVLVTISFDKDTETIVTEPVDDGPDRFMWKAEEMVRDIRTYFREWRWHIGDAPVRYFLRGVYDCWGATAVRPSGGVYFVMPPHRDMLGALKGMLEVASNRSPGSAQLDVIPIPNDERQKDMIRRAFEEESVGEAERMVQEISEILSDPDRRIREGTWEAIHTRYLTLTKKTTDYGGLVEHQLDRVTNTLELLRTFIIPLADRIGMSDEARASTASLPELGLDLNLGMPDDLELDLD